MALRKKQKDISQEKQSILRTARGRNGLMSTGMIAIVVAIVILFNLAVGLLPTKVRQFDLSTTKIYEISDTTKEYLANLKEKIHLVVVAEPDKIDSQHQSLPRPVHGAVRPGDHGDHRPGGLPLRPDRV